jgi:hypothetical protein
MKRGGQVMEQEIESIMEEGRQVPPAPDVVRARLLARARAAVAASRASSTEMLEGSTAAAWRGRRIAVAAGALLLLGTTGAAAALYSRVTRAPEIAIRVPEAPAVRTPAPVLPAEQPPELVPSTKSQRSHRAIGPQESYAAELQLLQRAQSEYASHDFANALVLVAEHGRRFPNGRLAEEREALRVRSLAHAGRGDEARRALASFAKRFPHSAFLPRLQEAARSADD